MLSVTALQCRAQADSVKAALLCNGFLCVVLACVFAVLMVGI